MSNFASLVPFPRARLLLQYRPLRVPQRVQFWDYTIIDTTPFWVGQVHNELLSSRLMRFGDYPKSVYLDMWNNLWIKWAYHSTQLTLH